MPTPIEILTTAVESYESCLQPSGEMIDPLIRQPTQYGTPYHALCQAVLALKGDPAGREDRLKKAGAGLAAALRHVADPALPATISGVERETGAVLRSNHRDFFWPPILKTYRILKGLGVEVSSLAEEIAGVDILASFRARPPSNWAMVWLSGEWLRFKEGLSPFDLARIDEWLGQFFENHILLDQGLYQEPGHPNSYDLFTRYHLADMLLDGYDGRWRPAMEKLMETGLSRSLQVQLSDGSLASAYRSTGQTWTLGAQCAFFTHAANFFQARGDERRQRLALAAAGWALASFRRWQRPGGPYSPVENLLPPAYRVGYERYTADGHYGNLAMGFLATAILHGFDGFPGGDGDDGDSGDLAARPPATFIEHDPVYRAIAHHGPYSVQANAFPSASYDGFGLVDLTFGPGRRLQLVSSARHLAGGKFYNPGLALRQEAGLSELMVMAHQETALAGPIEPLEPDRNGAGFQLRARVKGWPYFYELSVRVDGQGIQIEERTPNLRGYKSLLIPYLRDGGWGETTQVEVTGSTVWLRLGAEIIAFQVEGTIEQALDLPYGYENRRGLCGLLRLDLAGPDEAIRYRVWIEA